MLRTIAIFLTISTAAIAQDKPPTSLTDLPQTLRTIMGCASNWRGKDACEGERVWASVDKSGEITLFMSSTRGDSITGSGFTIDEAVRALAAKINASSAAANAAAIKRMAPLLPTQ